MMKILQFCYSDNNGPGKIALNLHNSINETSHRSFLYLRNNTQETLHSYTYKKMATDKKINLVKEFVNDLSPMMEDRLRIIKKKPTELFSYPFTHQPFNIFKRTLKELSPQIVHLHAINHGFLNEKQLFKLPYPLIFTIHSSYAFTGGCHYLNMGECLDFMNGCGNCPVLESSKKKDLSAKIFKKRASFMKKKAFGVISPSANFKKIASKSPLYKEAYIEHIPNPINQEQYKSLDQKMARDLLDLPQNCHLIGFGALSSFSSEATRKGFDLLKEALKWLKKNFHSEKKIILINFGESLTIQKNNFLPYPIIDLGSLKSDVHLALLYNSLDVLAFPSRFEVLPNMVAECLSCSTPVVAFNINGPNEQIDHEKNGYLAQSFNTYDFGKGLQFILSHPHPISLKENALNKASDWNHHKILNKHLEFYSLMLHKNETEGLS